MLVGLSVLKVLVLIDFETNWALKLMYLTMSTRGRKRAIKRRGSFTKNPGSRYFQALNTFLHQCLYLRIDYWTKRER